MTDTKGRHSSGQHCAPAAFTSEKYSIYWSEGWIRILCCWLWYWNLAYPTPLHNNEIFSYIFSFQGKNCPRMYKEMYYKGKRYLISTRMTHLSRLLLCVRSVKKTCRFDPQFVTELSAMSLQYAIMPHCSYVTCGRKYESFILGNMCVLSAIGT